MGNAAARQRLKFKDFAYIAKNTNFASRGVSYRPAILLICLKTILAQIVEDYYNDLIAKCPIGKMDLEVTSMFTWDGKTCSDEKNIPFRNSTHFSPSWCPESPPKISKSGHYGILRKGLFRFFLPT